MNTQSHYRHNFYVAQAVVCVLAVALGIHNTQKQASMPLVKFECIISTGEGLQAACPLGLQSIAVFAEVSVNSSQNMPLFHLRSTLLSANAKRYCLCWSMGSFYTAPLRSLRPAALSLEIIVSFCLEKPVAALRFPVLREGILSASATSAAT